MSTNNTVKHTQGVWKVIPAKERFDSNIYIVVDGMPDDMCIAQIDVVDETDHANAQYICDAVNNYEQVRELAGEMRGLIQHVHGYATSSNFTDRHGLGDRCKTLLEKANSILSP